MSNEAEESLHPESICIRITLLNTLEAVFGTSDEREQTTMREDVKNFAAEWMHHLEIPFPSDKEWQHARVELVALASVERENTLRKTLEWISRHPGANKEIRERVRKVLRECPESI